MDNLKLEVPTYGENHCYLNRLNELIQIKEFKNIEAEWTHQQQQIAEEIAELKNELADLKQKRQQLSGEVDPPTLTLYEKLRQQKKQAVARVEQGICRGCRISISASEVHRVRSGVPVQCSSCGRILFLP